MAFLARVSSSVATDYHRQLATEKRRASVVPIESITAGELTGFPSAAAAEFDSNSIGSILSWIDVERIVEGDPDRKNARRNALIFKLHYIDGFQAAEIARFPGFELTKSGVESILARMRKRIQE
jgi:DNA-directed RNA polymerase specialized sigma24 family protein